MRRVSVRIGRNFSPARKVLSMTAPSAWRRSFVRTKALPLPGFTCWNSTILKIVPSTSIWVPFLNWLVEITRRRSLASAGRQPPLLAQLLEVGLEGEPGRRPQLLRHLRPRRVEYLLATARAGGERVEQAALALEPMLEQLLDALARPPHERAVPRAQCLEVELEQAPQRGQVGGQRTLARRDEHAPLPEHSVAREEHATVEQGDMLGRVPRRRDRREGADALSVARACYRHVPRAPGELLGAVRVIGMVVGEDNPRERALARGA